MKRFLVFIFLQNLAFAQIQVALNWKAEPQFGGFYQAQINKELALSLIEGGSGTPTIQMLSFGQVDYAVVSAEEILISNDKNPKNPVVAVFAVFQTNPQVWITKKDRGMHSIKEILDQPGIISAQAGLTYVEFLKKKYPKIKARWVPYTGGIGGLISEKNYTQQGFLTSEPLVAEKKGISVSHFLIADEGFNPYTTVLAVRKSDLMKKKKEVEKLVNAVKKGWIDYINNPKPANLMMEKINQAMDPETFEKSAKIQSPLIHSPSLKDFSNLGQMSLERWQNLITILTDLKVIKSPLQPSDQFQNF